MLDWVAFCLSVALGMIRTKPPMPINTTSVPLKVLLKPNPDYPEFATQDFTHSR